MDRTELLKTLEEIRKRKQEAVSQKDYSKASELRDIEMKLLRRIGPPEGR